MKKRIAKKILRNDVKWTRKYYRYFTYERAVTKIGNKIWCFQYKNEYGSGRKRNRWNPDRPYPEDRMPF